MPAPLIRLAAALIALLICATPALPTTVAIFDITGGLNLGSERGRSALQFDGSFTADLMAFDPATQGDYTLTAAPTVNGTRLPALQLTLADTTFAAILANPTAALFTAFRASRNGMLTRLATNPNVSLMFDVDVTRRGPLTLAGSYEGLLTAPFPLDFSVFPDGVSRYSVALDVSYDGLPVVPLPATLPLLGAGLLGLLLLRRKRRR